MRCLIVMVLALLNAADANGQANPVEPKISIEGGLFFKVLKGTTVAIDARNSLSSEGLVWDSNDDVAYDVVSPKVGTENSILIVSDKNPAGRYTFHVTALGTSDGTSRKADSQTVIVTVMESHDDVPPKAPRSDVGMPVASVQGLTFVTPGSDLVLDGSGSQFDRRQGLKWAVNSGIPFGLVGPPGEPGTMLLVRQIPVGTHTFTLTASGTPGQDGNIRTHSVQHVVNVGWASPDAEALPRPSSQFNGSLSVSVIVGSGRDRMLEKVRLAGCDVRRSEDLFNFTYRTYDAASPELSRLHLRTYFEGGRDPFGKVWPKIEGAALIIQNEKGDVLLAERAPATGAGVLAKIVELRLE